MTDKPLEVGDFVTTRYTISTREDFTPKLEVWRVTEIVPTRKTKHGLEFTPPVDTPAGSSLHIHGDQAFRGERVYWRPLGWRIGGFGMAVALSALNAQPEDGAA